MTLVHHFLAVGPGAPDPASLQNAYHRGCGKVYTVPTTWLALKKLLLTIRVIYDTHGKGCQDPISATSFHSDC